MIGAGEVRLQFPVIKPQTCVDVDVDFPKGFLPNVSLYPVSKDARDDSVRVGTEILPTGESVLTFQFDAEEMTGLFGDRKEGWSKYSLVLDGRGQIYARQIGENGQKNPKRINVTTADWNGAPERIALLMAEVVAGWEVEQQLANPEVVNRNPAYQLALWLDKHRVEAARGVPSESLRKIKPPANELAVDVDQVEGFPPSLGVVTVTPKTTINRVLVSAAAYLGEPALRFAFRSEVDVPELGQKRSPTKEPNALDVFGTRVVLLTSSGIRVFKAEDKVFKGPGLKPSIATDRLAAILAGALIAVGVTQDPPVFARKIAEAAPQATSVGDAFLPKQDQVEVGDALGEWLKKHPIIRNFLEGNADAEPVWDF